MPTFVKAYTTFKGKKVRGYTRNAGYKKGRSLTGRIQRALNKISGALGYANMQGNTKRARTLKKRMQTVRSYMIANRL